MSPSLVRSGTSARPLAFASGRVASVLLLLVMLACGGEPAGTYHLGGGGTGGGSSGGSGGGDGPGAEAPAFSSVSAGGNHTCALTELGVAWCWGSNASGQLGTGTLSSTPEPQEVESGSTSFRLVSAGATHTCALDPNGVAYCWGGNFSGQLGDGNSGIGASSNVPVRVAGSRAWLSISAGTTHTCAIAENGTPFCWGSNASGELGTGDAIAVPVPTQVSGLAEALAITAGDRFSCALRSTGAAVCWGRDGRLGSAGASTVPRLVDGSATYLRLDAGADVTCGVESGTQRAACWGAPTLIGSEGGTGLSPTRVTFDAEVQVVNAGGTSACALSALGIARCWGSNASGQLGLGTAVTTTASAVPLLVTGNRVFSQVSVGNEHACAITQLLETFCWGSNAAGQLGLGTASTTPVRTPTRIP